MYSNAPMSKTIVITGAAGNLGRKLRTHFSSCSWNLRLLDRSARLGLDMTIADLSRYCGSWATAFSGADAVIHLAAEGWRATQHSAWRNNVVATENVLRAA